MHAGRKTQELVSQDTEVSYLANNERQLAHWPIWDPIRSRRGHSPRILDDAAPNITEVSDGFTGAVLPGRRASCTGQTARAARRNTRLLLP